MAREPGLIQAAWAQCHLAENHAPAHSKKKTPSQVEGVSVSQQLAQCEKGVGVALYEKVGRRVRVDFLPGNPTRTLYTAVRAGREGHPALRAFWAALGKAAATAKDFGPLPAV